MLTISNSTSPAFIAANETIVFMLLRRQESFYREGSLIKKEELEDAQSWEVLEGGELLWLGF